MIIEICSANEMIGCIEELEKEGFEVVAYPCLDRCGNCFVTPFVYADGDLIEGIDTDAVLQVIRQMKLEDDGF